MNQQQGFSLIETMVALVILAVGLTGLLGFSTMSIKAARDNEKWTTARMLAVSTQEELSARNFTELQTLAGSVGTQTGTRSIRMNNENYTVSWEFDRDGGTASSPLIISVRVSYPGMLGRPVEVNTVRYTLL